MKLVSITAGRDSFTLAEAARELAALGLPIDLVSAEAEELDSREKSFLEVLRAVRKADLVLVRIHGDPSRFKKFDRFKEVVEKAGRLTFVDCEGMREIMPEFRHLFILSDDEYDRVRKYVEMEGKDNIRGLLLWACRALGKMDVEVPDPVPPRTEGIYHPDHPRDIGLADYLATLDPGRPTVGIMFPQGIWLTDDLEPIDALVRAVESVGANALPAFLSTVPSEITGSLGIRKVIERYFMDGGVSRVGSVLLNMGFSQLPLSSPGTGSPAAEVHNFFRDLDVPVLQVMTLWKTRAAWEEDPFGLNAMEISVDVIGPEFDGQVITVPVAFAHGDESGRRCSRSVPERVMRVASLAKAYAELGRTPPAQRKVVIMLWAPQIDRVGTAAGLDTFQSLVSMLRAMKDEGYALDHLPADGKELLDEIMSGVTNDTEWLSKEEVLERTLDTVSAERYQEWFDAIDPRSREEMRRSWGRPPGEMAAVDGRLIVPGVRNGNVLIALQPLRGLREQAEELTHSTDVVIPHQYLSYYRWLKEDFGAQVIVHMGTHGTLEWLPGKSVGLSERCYPDIVLGSIPNLYPYIIHNPGEGAGAKRRSAAVLVDHLIPAMARAESYDELMELDGRLQEYFRAVNSKQKDQAAVALQKVHELVKGLSMMEEAGLAKDATAEELAGRLNVLYDHVVELKDALIRDGLHIMGKPPEGKRLEEMIYSLTRLPNGPKPSLRDAVAEGKGLDLRDLQDRPSEMHPQRNVPKGALLDEVDGECHALLEKMMELGFRKEECMSLAGTMYPDGGDRLREVTEFVCDRVVPGIMDTVDEIGNLLRGLDGGYVPPGPSGSPTRGNAHLLPTGRNFFTIDPDSIPGPASWEIGKKMADQMIERHVKEMGCYPKNVGIVIWAIDTMRTGGDDIAYILWLMGLRPKRSATGSRVIGLEVIPLAELGRPRIDVTLRISGLFRDTFPNLIEMIDQGVEIIGSLNESDEENYLASHLREDLQKAIRQGLSPKEARSMVTVRIFGDPPGTYGYGIDKLIESSKWSISEDLAETYVTWGCHAYGRGRRGEKVSDFFKDRMSKLDVTVKNHEDREFDLLDVDDEYGYLGGMNTMVKVFGNRKAYTVMGDSSDPQRIKTRTLEEEVRFVFRSRVLNPKWLEGLKEHGYRGAQELSYVVEYSLGWDATTGVIEPWMYEGMAERFLLDKETRKWLEEDNPYALREMAGRLLEVIQRGLWEPSEEMKKKIRSVYLDAEALLEEANEPE
jgi:cobaltochelatase CobN